METSTSANVAMAKESDSTDIELHESSAQLHLLVSKPTPPSSARGDTPIPTAPVPAKTRQPRVEGLDALRGICAIGVVFFHVFHKFDNWSNPFSWSDGFGTQGTYMFFTISGASLYYSIDPAKELDQVTFMAKRFIRLLPLLIPMSIWQWQARDLDSFADFCWRAFLTWTFAYSFAEPYSMSRVVANAWSLGVEMVYYVMFPLMAQFVRRSKPLKEALVFAFLVSIQSVYLKYVWLPHNGERLEEQQRMQPVSTIAYFFAGVLIGKYTPQLLKVPLWIRLFVGVGMFALTIGVPLSVPERVSAWRGALLCVSSVLCVCGFVVEHLPGADTLGKSSYGVYLIHQSVIYEFKKHHPLDKWPMVGATLGISIPLALILERIYERPIQSFLRRLLARSSA